jgi:hypothetical protein
MMNQRLDKLRERLHVEKYPVNIEKLWLVMESLERSEVV